MCKLLVRTVDGENAHRYMRGDVVAVLPDDHVFGRMESLAVWTAEGLDPAKWPGGFAVVDLTGMTVEAGAAYLESDATRRRTRMVALDVLERRDPVGGRDTLRTESQITRRAADVQEAFRTKP